MCAQSIGLGVNLSIPCWQSKDRPSSGGRYDGTIILSTLSVSSLATAPSGNGLSSTNLHFMTTTANG